MDIQKALAENNIIIFAGSGLSIPLNLPDWNNMVIESIKNLNKPYLIPFIDLLSNQTMSPVDVLEYLKTDKQEIYSYIHSNFKIHKDSNLHIHKKLLKLSNNKIITTNYDNAFELSCDNNIIPSKPTSKYTINGINKNNNEFIFKLHGSFEEPDNCIVFKEDYEKLYSIDNNEAAPEKLKTLFANSTFLFVGFGFNDPDIDFIFDKMNKTFGGLNKHFILTPNPQNFEKYNFLEAIKLDDYSHLETKIDELIKIKDENTAVNLTLSEEKKNIGNSLKKIAILFPDIIDQNHADEYKSSITQFENIQAEILTGYLNLDTLNLIDDYDLLIIISNVYKNKIYIEENNLKSNLINIEEIVDNIPNSSIPVLLLTNEEIDLSNISHPMYNIFNYKNQTIKKFLHKVITEKTFSFSDSNIKNNGSGWIIDLQKGKSIKNNIYGNNRNLEIGKKCLTEVIGRIEEQSNLISRFLLINRTNKVLNIKASGGLGKTTLVKKISYELYNRGHYKSGVNFKSCENVKSFEDLEELIIDGFNFSDIINFKEHLLENFSNDKIDLLLILDNFETVVNNLDETNYLKVIELLEFVSDYSNIVITSRDLISNKEFEEVFHLTPMTTDDALELFKLNYKGKKIYTSDEVRILRTEILEDLLANNPLAIKLVTTSRPEMDITNLRNQIKNHFFESINEEYSRVFKDNADLNIERTKSIYQSINYSYSFLTTRQKLAFELLSLFPDGINLQDFKKCFKKSKSSNDITDTEIKQLENKSLLENYNGILQLQPIIRRFSNYQFEKKNNNNKQKYCLDAYEYNCYILKMLGDIQKSKSHSVALKIFSSLKNNFLEVLQYLIFVEINEKGIVPNKEYLLNYIYLLADFLTNSQNIFFFIEKIGSLLTFFEDIPHSNQLIKTLINRKIYYQSEFDLAYREMCKLLSVEDMEVRDYNNETKIEKRWKNLITPIHSMEGYTIPFIQSLIKNNDFQQELFSNYHYLGIDNITFNKKFDAFYYFENELRKSRLSIDEIKNYIESLYMEEHLQIMQCTYTLSKIEKISIKNIKKLVVTNPYTRGLKNLMFAFNTENEKEKIDYFEKALKNLQHIKYYYLEALYYYCIFLKDNDTNKYKETLSKGLELAIKYKYQYLHHLFKNNNDKYVFSYEYYGLVGIDQFIEKDINEWYKIYSN